MKRNIIQKLVLLLICILLIAPLSGSMASNMLGKDEAQNPNILSDNQLLTYASPVYTKDTHHEDIPVYGGAAAGSIVTVSISVTQITVFNLLLSQQAINGSGNLYVSVEVPSIPSFAGLMWFRPSDQLTPPYVHLVKGPGGFFPGAELAFYHQGALAINASDLSFVIGTSGLVGQTIVFKTWYLEQGLPFNTQFLRVIQSVTVIFS